MHHRVSGIEDVAREIKRALARGVAVVAIAGAPFCVACSALLNAEDVEFSAAEASVNDREAALEASAPGEAGADAGDAGAIPAEAAARADGQIACGDTPCDSVAQACCLSWENGTDYCVAGQPPSCDAGAHPSSVIQCDDPTDCERGGETGLVCCLFDDAPSAAQFHSACVRPSSCVAPVNRRMCLSIADCGGASCVAVPSSRYYACAP